MEYDRDSACEIIKRERTKVAVALWDSYYSFNKNIFCFLCGGQGHRLISRDKGYFCQTCGTIISSDDYKKHQGKMEAEKNIL